MFHGLVAFLAPTGGNTQRLQFIRASKMPSPMLRLRHADPCAVPGWGGKKRTQLDIARTYNCEILLANLLPKASLTGSLAGARNQRTRSLCDRVQYD
jgi:hypothetical protein